MQSAVRHTNWVQSASVFATLLISIWHLSQSLICIFSPLLFLQKHQIVISKSCPAAKQKKTNKQTKKLRPHPHFETTILLQYLQLVMFVVFPLYTTYMDLKWSFILRDLIEILHYQFRIASFPILQYFVESKQKALPYMPQNSSAVASSLAATHTLPPPSCTIIWCNSRLGQWYAQVLKRHLDLAECCQELHSVVFQVIQELLSFLLFKNVPN